MKWLPTSRGERWRVVILGLLLATTVVFISYGQFGGRGTPAAVSPAAPVPAASNAQGGRPPAAPAAGAQMPVPLNLARVERRGETPSTERNPFRFGTRPAPPLPPPPSRPMLTTPMPQASAGPPPIPLKLTGLMADPYGRPRAYLKDPASGALFEVVDGQVVDGRYRVVKIGVQSVVLSYLDGSGQRTVPLGG